MTVSPMTHRLTPSFPATPGTSGDWAIEFIGIVGTVAYAVANQGTYDANVRLGETFEITGLAVVGSGGFRRNGAGSLGGTVDRRKQSEPAIVAQGYYPGRLTYG